ncbi:class I SAM-dependent methyltransferase [Marinobacteraceae bacterium S3BR75-40.1]
MIPSTPQGANDQKNERALSDAAQRMEAFARWLETPLGEQLLVSEREAVNHALTRLFGVRHLEMGVAPEAEVSSLVNCGHRMLAISGERDSLPDGTVVCRNEELPFPDDSVDLVVMHHTLDYADYPHQALREASRVLRGGGHLVLVGFNPFSFWGLKRLLARGRSMPWSGRFIGRRRIEDWLSLLDFEPGLVDFHFIRPPVQNARLLNRLAFLEKSALQRHIPGGAFYVVVAEKRVGAMIRLRPQWSQKKVVALPLANRSRAVNRMREQN